MTRHYIDGAGRMDSSNDESFTAKFPFYPDTQTLHGLNFKKLTHFLFIYFFCLVVRNKIKVTFFASHVEFCMVQP